MQKLTRRDYTAVFGALLISAGFTLILLPFSLVSNAIHSWESASIIVMIVMGVVCLAAFAFWERSFAPVQFFPFRLLKDRTVLVGPLPLPSTLDASAANRLR